MRTWVVAVFVGVLAWLGFASPARAAPQIALAPDPVDFGAPPPGETWPGSITISNTGTSPLTVSALHITGDPPFRFDDQLDPICGTGRDCAPALSLAAGASRTIYMVCTPSAVGFLTGTLTVASDATNAAGNSTVALACAGAAPASMTTLVASPATLDYGVVYAEAPITILDRTVRITNTAVAPSTPVEFDIVAPGATSNGWFELLTGGGGYLGPGEAQDITVRFHWFGASYATAPLILRNRFPPNDTVAVPVTAQSAYADLVFDSPADLWMGANLPAVPYGQTSTLTITAHNAGAYELLIENAYAYGSFGGTAELVGPAQNTRLAPGATISWTLRCTPDGADGYDGVSGSLDFSYNYAAHDLDSFPLWCPGLGARLALDRDYVPFGDVARGTTATTTVHLRNAGNQPTTVVGITSDDPAVTAVAALPVDLAPGDQVDVEVRYAPTTSGDITATLTFDAATGFDTTMIVTGTGYAAGAAIDPPMVSYGDVDATSPHAIAVTLTNTGERPLVITAIATDAPAEFTAGLTAGTAIAAGDHATFDVVISPQALGPRHATLTLTTDGAGALTVPLVARATDPLLPITTDDPVPGDLALAVGAVDVDVGARHRAVAIHNDHAAAIELTSCAATGTFAVTSTCPLTLAAGADAALDVAFDPDAVGAATGTLTITGAGFATGAIALPLTGTGIDQQVTLSTSVLEFPATYRWPITAPRATARLRNDAATPLVIDDVGVTGAGFSLVGAASATIAPGAEAGFEVAFAPDAIGAFDGELRLGNADDPAIARIALHGAGVARGVTVTPATIDLGTIEVGQTRSTRDLGASIVITNHDAAAFAISAIELTGDGFALDGAAPTTLAASGTAALDVAVTPTAPGALTGVLAVRLDGDPTPIARISLTATAVPPAAPATGCGCQGGAGDGGALVVLALLRRRRRR